MRARFSFFFTLLTVDAMAEKLGLAAEVARCAKEGLVRAHAAGAIGRLKSALSMVTVALYLACPSSVALTFSRFVVVSGAKVRTAYAHLAVLRPYFLPEGSRHD